MFSNVVMGVDADLFENALTQARLVAGVRVDSELSAEDLQELVETFKGIFSDNVEAALYPERSGASAAPCYPGRLWQLDERARLHLPQAARHFR